MPKRSGAARTGTFWLLAGGFAICGATTNGLMWSHFTPAVHDHGMAPTAASSLLALIGFANIAGTISAGWLTDRIEPRALLAVFFLIRATALAILPTIFTSEIDAGLIAFAVAFGILDVATSNTATRAALERQNPVLAAEIEVLAHAQVGIQAEALRHVADAPLDRFRLVAGIKAEYRRCTGRRPQHAAEHPNDRRLTAAVGSDDADAAFGEFDGDITDHPTAVERV